MEFNQILELIKTISDSKVTSFTLEEGDSRLTIKAGDSKAPQVVQIPVPQPTVAPVPAFTPQMAIPQAPVAEMAQPEAGEKTEDDANLKVIKSPLVGTFYSAPSPDDAPFVSVGDTVKKGQVIGIVEAMKLMNEIESEHDGIVTEIVVNNGDMVEYGQVLIKVK